MSYVAYGSDNSKRVIIAENIHDAYNQLKTIVGNYFLMNYNYKIERLYRWALHISKDYILTEWLIYQRTIKKRLLSYWKILTIQTFRFGRTNMNNVIVKNTNKRGSTTVTIKVTSELKHEWEKFCINNNINQSQTLKNVLIEIMKDNKC